MAVKARDTQDELVASFPNDNQAPTAVSFGV